MSNNIVSTGSGPDDYSRDLSGNRAEKKVKKNLRVKKAASESVHREADPAVENAIRNAQSILDEISAMSSAELAQITSKSLDELGKDESIQSDPSSQTILAKVRSQRQAYIDMIRRSDRTY